MGNIKVLVVDDSLFMRRMITDLIQESENIEVVATAKDGLDAINKVEQFSPDIITLDVEMPVINGIEALKAIMEKHPVPVIMLSRKTKQGTDTTIQALQLGAFDFLAKPSGGSSSDINEIKDELIDKILIANEQKEKWIKQWHHSNNRKEISTKKVERIIEYPKQTNGYFDGIVAVGTSTGGPKALQEVISNIPSNFPYPILIVQHMPAGFTNSLASRLNNIAKIHVTEAIDGETIKPATAYIAPGNYHMTMKKTSDHYKINLNQKEPVRGHRPSVDILFESLIDIRLKKVFVVMTGMGQDGTNGVKIAKNDKDILIVENEDTCVVYGMPKSAVTTGLVDVIVPLHQIADHIISNVQN